ncbi:RXT2-like protein [Xylogone sp. PMI_703]|nr:RXT2-like protein [Xylogone sp. PMI_703]
MASQAALFAETIAGMKKAIKRKVYDSDSDESITQITNRGNKLRRKARYVHEGQLAPPSGPIVYKRRIEHAGFYRDIISRKPPLIDEDGYEVDSEDDDEERAEAAMVAAAEFDPYADVRIEHLLAPLTAASDLPDHPTLSRPFTSKTVTELTKHVGEMLQKERLSLWKIRHLLTRFSGDHTWIPCEMVETENDFALFGDDRDRHHRNGIIKSISKDELDGRSTGTIASEDVVMKDGEQVVNAGEPTQPGGEDHGNATSGNHDIADVTVKQSETKQTGNEFGDRPPSGKVGSDNPETPIEGVNGADAEMITGDQEDLPAPRRMRTRAQAHAASDSNTIGQNRSFSPESEEEAIHPYFLAPSWSRPDRDIGLPQQEAEDTRRLLQLYIQKQEEVCRGLQRLYEGLCRAERYRKLVLKWAKAEAHVGVNRDMSDGEDWYDKEEWGLDADLKKGQDEEEEDAATTAKKTRTRRQ